MTPLPLLRTTDQHPALLGEVRPRLADNDIGFLILTI